MRIVAWHNDPGLKARTVDRMIEHRRLDEFRGNHYTSVTSFLRDGDLVTKFSGCFHGCLVFDEVMEECGTPLGAVQALVSQWNGKDWHRESEQRFGIPVPLGQILDALFEAVPGDDKGDFAVGTLQVMAPGADLLTGMERWMHRIVADPHRGLIALAEGEETKIQLGHLGRFIDWQLTGRPRSQGNWQNMTTRLHMASEALGRHWTGDQGAYQLWKQQALLTIGARISNYFAGNEGAAKYLIGDFIEGYLNTDERLAWLVGMLLECLERSPLVGPAEPPAAGQFTTQVPAISPRQLINA